MKRVLFVVNSNLDNAGVPNVLMQIVRKLKEEFVFDIVVGNSAKGFFDDEFLSYGGKIFRHDLVDYSKSKVFYGKRGKQTYQKVKEVLKENKYDIIHCKNGVEAGFALKAAYKVGVPIRIVHSHGTYSNRGKNIFARLYKLSGMKKGVKYSTHRFACSNVAGETLFLGSKFENILNPLDVNNYLKINKKEHDYIGLLQIGYYCKLKNQLFSLKVLQELLNRGHKAKLRFIGYDSGSGYINKVINEVNNKNLTDNVEFLPSDFNKNEVLETTDFLLLPSESEGLPLVALEAQSSRSYCIASSNVSEDVDVGLFNRFPISGEQAPSAWAEFIIQNKDYVVNLNMEKLQSINSDEYMKKITNIYNAPEKFGGGENINLVGEH